VIQNPKYRYLFGPVSISNNYSKLSKRIIVSYLKKECSDDSFVFDEAFGKVHQKGMAVSRFSAEVVYFVSVTHDVVIF
jgi:hypothetical protein